MKKWEWFGNAAHFICGHRCRFHMATKIGKYLISTVGEMKVDQNDEEFSEIGYQRKYETMVFLAGKRCREKVCGCGLPKLRNGNNLDFFGYNNARDATKGHMKLCLKWSKKK